METGMSRSGPVMVAPRALTVVAAGDDLADVVGDGLQREYSLWCREPEAEILPTPRRANRLASQPTTAHLSSPANASLIPSLIHAGSGASGEEGWADLTR
jgi:hypothetical protein